MTTDLMEQLQDAVAGTWSIERELGRGGMGVVYLARDVALDRPVAIKVLHPELAADSEQRVRFIGEARTGARLSHPHLVPIYAVEERGDIVFFVMALIDGESVGEKVRRQGPLDAPEAERIMREIGWGLAYAHVMELVHRDVTLDNILLERSTGRAVLADFGIASEIDRVGEGNLVGTPAYLAPEVIQGEGASPRSDLYALGIASWTMLAGRTPFIADDASATLLMHVSEPVPSLKNAAPRTPSRLIRAIENALQKSPADRPHSIEDWIGLLDTRETGSALAAPLQRWTTRWELVRPFYALSMSVIAMVTAERAMYLLEMMAGRYGRGTEFLWSMVQAGATVLLAALIVHAGIEISMLRKLARQGYDVNDLDLALATAQSEARRAGTRKATLLGRVVHDIGWLGGVLYALLALAMMKWFWVFLPSDYDRWQFGRALQEIGLWAYVAFMSSLGFSFIVPAFHLKPDSMFVRLRNAFWRSSLARGLMRVASIGLPRGAAPENTLHRPTELVLDLAIEELWQALPTPAQESMSEVPSLVASLRRRVAQLRETERLFDALTPSRGGDVATIRQRLADRHAAGVTALERIRLLLARLGSEAAPAGAFTQQLQDAREVEQSLLTELGAHSALVKQLKKGRRATSITPAMTPAT